MGALVTLIPVLGQLIDRVFPDKAKADEAKLELMKMQMANDQFLAGLADKAAERDTDLVKGQLEINKAEAQNASVFVSGWRPGIGWVCVLAFACQFVIFPLLATILPIFHITIEFPKLDTSDLMTVLAGLLGLGGFRTYERVKGVIPKGK